MSDDFRPGPPPRELSLIHDLWEDHEGWTMRVLSDTTYDWVSAPGHVFSRQDAFLLSDIANDIRVRPAGGYIWTDVEELARMLLANPLPEAGR